MHAWKFQTREPGGPVGFRFQPVAIAFFNLKKTAAGGVDGVTWQDYEQDLKDLQMRFARFGLKLHASKTRLIEFGKYAAEHRDRRNEGRPETFDFLGFTHKCARTRKHGWFAIHRHSIAKRMRATFQKIAAVHRAAANAIDFRTRAARGSVCNGLFVGSALRIRLSEVADKTVQRAIVAVFVAANHFLANERCYLDGALQSCRLAQITEFRRYQ